MTGRTPMTRLQAAAAALGMSIGLCFGVSGCLPPGEGCEDFPTAVVLYAEPFSGPVPLTVEFSADAHGHSCGCCGGQHSEIAEYRWDLDGDGIPDIQGESTSTVSHTFTEAGDYIISVTVVDTDSVTASASITITVTE
jgi:PKD repeat protein